MTSRLSPHRPLDALWEELVSARAAVVEARQGPQGAASMTEAARQRLIAALEAYTAELQAHNLPIPYRLRDDLRLQRRALGPSR